MAALDDIIIATARLIAPKRHGLATFPYITALVAGVDIEWDDLSASTWSVEHADTLFEHLPVFEKDGLLVAQPFAIVRYLAFLGEIQGQTPGAFAQSEMLTEEVAELYSLFETGPEKLNPRLERMEKLLFEDFFTGSQPVQADAVVWTLCYLVGRYASVAFETKVLDKLPRLKEWYSRMAGLDAITNSKTYLDSIPQ